MGKYAQEDAAIVEALFECGAIFYVKTNVPQSVMVNIPVAYNHIQ